MNCDYADIRSRIPEPPKWFDEHGVPRYCDFAPGEQANIYADEVVLALVTCQGCGHEFSVCFSHTMSFAVAEAIRDGNDPHGVKSLADLIRLRELHYGDPPNIQCCPSGPTMNSELRRVIEYWQLGGDDKRRLTALEVDISPDWV